MRPLSREAAQVRDAKQALDAAQAHYADTVRVALARALLDEVRAVTGLSRSSLYRLAAQPERDGRSWKYKRASGD